MPSAVTLDGAILQAAGTAPAFFTEIAAILVASALMAYVCHRLHIMPIVSFLVAGALIGPHALGLVHDEALIEAAAEVGVILLLFTIGIEFSLEKLGRIKRLILIGGGLQVCLSVGLVAAILRLFGVAWHMGIFTGFLVALSSTAIVMKYLMDRSETNSESGQAALGILIFQDLAVIGMVLVVPMLAGESGSAGGLLLAIGKAIGIVIVVLVVARRVMPAILEAVARTCSQEIFLLTVIAVCFGTAWLTSLAGVSLSLGAFLAGIIISESRFSELAFGEILPLQILFSATFFVSVGLLLDIGFIVAHPLLILVAVGAVLPVKVLTTGLSLRLLGYAAGSAGFTGLLLAQVGEFSFVLEQTGRRQGLFPAGFEDGGPQAFIAATVLLMIGTPMLAALGERAKRRNVSRKPKASPQPQPQDAAPDAATAERGHVIIAGYGDTGRRLARILSERRIPFLIVTLSPDGAREAESENLPVLRGNYMRQHELDLAGARSARSIVVADDDLETTRRVVSAARALSDDLEIVARTRFESEIEELRDTGATLVVADEQEGMIQIVTSILDSYAVAQADVREQQAAIRTGRDDPATDGARPSGPRVIALTEDQQNTRRCSHTASTTAVSSSATGCAECIELGDTWVHLRICMSCGNVGCCDSSRNKHATMHHLSTSHPIIKSYQPGEAWAWCYEDRVRF